ncbi:helix-turn-helix domain-containing protein [Amycolatopsis sp. NPDC005003]
MLDIIGLREADLEVYQAFAGSGSMTLAQLREATALTEDRLRPVLRVLIRKGLLARLPGTPRTYAPVRPEVAIGAMLGRKDQELAAARLVAAQLEAQFRDAPAQQAVDLIEVVHGNDRIAERADRLLRQAKQEVAFVDKPPYAQPPTVLHPAEREMLGQGVRFRGVYDRSALELHDLPTDLEAGLVLGEEARVVPEAPLKMILVDRDVGLIPLRSDLPEIRTALVIRRCALLDALSALFALLWREGLPLRLPATEQPGVLSVDDARLLALLTTGLPDRSIAKQLGMSYRTFQRRLRHLMTQLGAGTRFQAGLQAATRGWVALPRPDVSD